MRWWFSLLKRIRNFMTSQTRVFYHLLVHMGERAAPTHRLNMSDKGIAFFYFFANSIYHIYCTGKVHTGREKNRPRATRTPIVNQHRRQNISMHLLKIHYLTQFFTLNSFLKAALMDCLRFDASRIRTQLTRNRWFVVPSVPIRHKIAASMTK